MIMFVCKSVECGLSEFLANVLKSLLIDGPVICVCHFTESVCVLIHFSGDPCGFKKYVVLYANLEDFERDFLEVRFSAAFFNDDCGIDAVCPDFYCFVLDLLCK